MLFPGRQGTRSAMADKVPGADDPASVTIRAAMTMHDDLAEEARKLANGSRNVPLHSAMVPREGSDAQGFGGDSAAHDPTGIGRGT
jgi:hypothetical protein